MFIYKCIKYTNVTNKLVSFKNVIYILKKYTDTYSITFFCLNGILIWLNILHINIILVKHSFLILLNNLEYLIILNSIDKYNIKNENFGRKRRERERRGEEKKREEDLREEKVGRREEEGRKKRDRTEETWGGRGIEGEFGKRSINGEREEEGTVLKNRN